MGKKGFWANGTTLGMGGDNFNNWTELTGNQITDEIRGYFNPQTAVADGKSGRLSTNAGAVAGKTQYNSYGQALQPDGTYAGVTYGQRNAAAAGMLGADGRTGMTVDERRAWMDGAGKDYLASLNGGNGLGFSSADYTGTAAQNRALFNAYKGFGAWQSAQPTVYTNQQLLGMTDEQAAAAGLSEGDIARRTKLNNYQTSRNTALTFNGQQYADEATYNAAVDDYNLAQMGQAAAATKAAQNQLAANRLAAAGNNSRRQKTFDLMGQVLNGEKDFASLSGMEQRALRRMRNRDMKNGHYSDENTAKNFYALKTVTVPKVAGQFKGNAALTEDQLNATTFKKGGQLNYANYLN